MKFITHTDKTFITRQGLKVLCPALASFRSAGEERAQGTGASGEPRKGRGTMRELQFYSNPTPKPPGELPYEKVGDARQKFELNPRNEINLGVARDLFDFPSPPKKTLETVTNRCSETVPVD